METARPKPFASETCAAYNPHIQYVNLSAANCARTSRRPPRGQAGPCCAPGYLPVVVYRGSGQLTENLCFIYAVSANAER